MLTYYCALSFFAGIAAGALIIMLMLLMPEKETRQ